MDNSNNQNLNSGSYNLNASAHPGLLILDIIFKSIPIVIYFLISSFAVCLGILTIVSSIDFWFTKNILGRICAGLKWGKIIEENGRETFYYDCKKDEKTINNVDKKFFWTLLVVSACFWAISLILNILSFSKLLMILLPFSLNAYNLYAFFKCSREQQDKMNQFIKDQKEQGTEKIVNNYLKN